MILDDEMGFKFFSFFLGQFAGTVWNTRPIVFDFTLSLFLPQSTTSSSNVSWTAV